MLRRSMVVNDINVSGCKDLQTAQVSNVDVGPDRQAQKILSVDCHDLVAEYHQEMRVTMIGRDVDRDVDLFWLPGEGTYSI